MKPSPQQADFYQALLQTSQHLALEATAGSGKTTTIVQAAKLLPSSSKRLFLAFNKSIVVELSKRLPAGVRCDTLHAMGMKALQQRYRGKLAVNEFKTMNYCDGPMRSLQIEEKQKMGFKFAMRELVDLARMTLCDWEVEAVLELADRYGLSIDEKQAAAAIVILRNMERYNFTDLPQGEQGRIVDYTDMVYLPATTEAFAVPQFDYVFIDEAQDLNACQRLFVERLLVPETGRLISVGDPRQSIYGFAGSDIFSFTKLQQRPNTLTLPLSVSFRCAARIVAEANKVYPEIQAATHAKAGEVRLGSSREITDGDLIICRNTKPLIELFFVLIDRDQRCSLAGKDIEKGLLSLVGRVSHMGLSAALKRLDGMLLALEQQLVTRGVKKPTEHPRYVNLADKVEVIELIAQRSRTMEEVRHTITNLFAEVEGGAKLMTIHRSKGLEATRVFLLRPDLMPSKFAVADWELVQEKNLRFVAYTRAKDSLIILPMVEPAEYSEEMQAEMGYGQIKITDKKWGQTVKQLNAVE
jgi:DNA helicase-2/ATP-dependent DNA helicase PcrA